MSGGDILREVDEAVRVEKAMRFWKDHGKTLIAIVAFIILGTAVQSGWSNYRASQDKAATSAYLDALRDKEPMAALTKLSDTQDGASSALASLTAASMKIAESDYPAAIAIYEKVTGNKSAPKTYKDLAIVQIASLKTDHDDKASADDLLKLLTPVVADKKSAWNSRAVLVAAIIKATKKSDYQAARADLAGLLADKSLPSSFVEQVRALDEVYRIKGESKSAQ